MTIEQAIQHCREIVKNDFDCDDCKKEYLQLMIWLEELKSYRKRETENYDMFNKNYTGRKNIKRSEVFDSAVIFPADWFRCKEVAARLNYRYIEFNNNIYDLNDYKKKRRNRLEKDYL